MRKAAYDKESEGMPRVHVREDGVIRTEAKMPPHGALNAWLHVWLHLARKQRRAFWIKLSRCPVCYRKLRRVISREEWRWGTNQRTGRTCAKQCTFISDYILVDSPPTFYVEPE